MHPASVRSIASISPGFVRSTASASSALAAGDLDVADDQFRGVAVHVGDGDGAAVLRKSNRHRRGQSPRHHP